MSKGKYSWTLTTLAILAFWAAMSRGLLQLAVARDLSYVLSMAPLGGLMAILALQKARMTRFVKPIAWVLGANLMIATISLLMTKATGGQLLVVYLPFYLATPVLLLWGLLFVSPYEKKIPWALVIALCGWYLTVWGVLDTLRIVHLPGGWYAGGLVRTPGSTGSKQHFSIAIAIVAVLCLQFAVWKRSKLQLLSFVAFSLMTVISLGRSGIFILFVGIAFSVAVVNAKLRLRVLIGASACALLLLSFLTLTPWGHVYTERILSVADVEQQSNNTRIYKFRYLLETWFYDTNKFVGERFGEYSQVNSKIFEEATSITESSITMTLLHTGLLGLIAYYAPFWLLISYVWKRARILAGLLVACVIQSGVYMSVECLPYIVLLGAIPLIYRSLEGAAEPAGNLAPSRARRRIRFRFKWQSA